MENYDAIINRARELASQGAFAQAISVLGPLPLGHDRMADLIEEFETLTKKWMLREHNALYRPTLERVCSAIRNGEIERTASAFRTYRAFVRYGHGPRIEDDMYYVVHLMFEFILEPLLLMGIRAVETGDHRTAEEYFDLAEQSAWMMGVNIPNMLEKTREHLDARRAH